MTNEEAIEHLKNIKIFSYQDGYTAEAREALDMAINALTKEAWKEEHPVSPLLQKPATTAQPEPSQVARDIATIIENETDMRVINAQPQRTGRWIHQVKFGRIECDQCGKVYRNAFVPKNYCPNCGASMTEKAEENDGTNER